MTDLLAIRDLRIAFRLHDAVIEAVRGISFSVPQGGTVALVGESGSGKTVVSQAVLGILPTAGRITGGQILFSDPVKPGETVDLAQLPRDSEQYRQIRGGRISIIFQEPMTALSPLHTVGNQVGESLGLHGRHSATPPGLGFTAIAVGLVGRNHPFGVIFAALLFGLLSAGAPSMQANSGVSKEIVFVLQGLVILAVAAFEAVNRLPFLRTLTTPGAPSGSDRSSQVGMEPEIETRPAPPAI